MAEHETMNRARSIFLYPLTEQGWVFFSSSSSTHKDEHRTYGNIEVGRQILQQLLAMEPYNSGLYVLLSNIYYEVVRWKDVKKIRNLMDDCGIKNCRAISLIEIDGCVHEFLVDDKSHEIWSSIHSMLDQLTQHLKFSGYSCNISSAYLDVDEI